MSYGRERSYGGRFEGQRGYGGPKPVESGKEYDVEITEISRQGDGIARIQGFVIFVKGARVGQKTRVKITNVGARFATAVIVSAATSGNTEGSSQPKSDVAPPVKEAEKPELQDYKSEEKPSEST